MEINRGSSINCASKKALSRMLDADESRVVKLGVCVGGNWLKRVGSEDRQMRGTDGIQKGEMEGPDV